MANSDTRVVISHVHCTSRTNAAVRAILDRRFNEAPTIISHNLSAAHKLLKKYKTQDPVLVYMTNPFVGQELRACPVSVVLVVHPYSHQAEWMISRNNVGGLCAKLYKYGVASEAGFELDPTDALFEKLVHLLSATLPRLPGVRSGYLNRGRNLHAPVQRPSMPTLSATSTPLGPRRAPVRHARTSTLSAPPTPLASSGIPSHSASAATNKASPAPSTGESPHGCATTYPDRYEEILTPFAPDGLENCQYACLLRSRDDFGTLSPPDQFIAQYVRLETPSLYLKLKGKFFAAYRGSVEAGITRSVDEWAKDISNTHSNRRLRRSNSVRLYRCYEALGWLGLQHFRD